MPPDFWSVVAAVSFWSWAVVMGRFIARAFPGRSFDRRQGVRLGGLALILAICWVIGLSKA